MTTEATSVRCEICGEPTAFEFTKQCNGCWEVTSRLDRFLRHEKARVLVWSKLITLGAGGP